ncbi:ABC transporter domain-containing protein [Hyphomicrobiales bacterium]|nr:ABC transporter domain-containing protein [Hyphomicrobiales bacterium]CAH1698132.1 ABC transporter domain-containing protein [Hyphomicrobiales bacterium]CAI0347775.1 lipopolysaccharide transport system ATP-binding protein [Hyphomicrobiales bacterium]
MKKAIIAEGLSKRFRIGRASDTESGNLRDSIGRMLHSLRPSAEDDETTDFWALKDISFEVDLGERMAVIGRNGSGKSTLLKVLSRVMAPTSGKVSVRGRLSSLLEVGTGFHPELTGRENIFLSGAVLGMKQAEVKRRFDEIVEFSEIAKFLDTPVKRYSSGMYVRLAFGVAAHLEPDILILDEVMAVGDSGFQAKSQKKLDSLAKEGRTVLFVSHSMAAVRGVCDTALLLDAGRAGPKQAVESAVRKYLNTTIKRRTASLPIITDDIVLVDMNVTQDTRNHMDFVGEEQIAVSIEVEVLTPIDDLRLGFYIKTIDGHVIARALFDDWDVEKSRFPMGHFVLEGIIPANLLVHGEYIFEVHGSRFGTCDYFGEAGQLSFRVAEAKDYNVAYKGEQPFGYVHIDPQWQMQRI